MENSVFSLRSLRSVAALFVFLQRCKSAREANRTLNLMHETQLDSNSLANGRVIREPVGFENGYWVGAPGVFYVADEKALYLTYRIRRPRGVAPDRGGEARIARSTDFRNFEDVRSVTKDRLQTASIERCALRKGLDGQWRYFVCLVDPAIRLMDAGASK